MKNYPSFPMAVYLLLWRDDQVLMMRRFQTGYCDGQYSLVAGHVEYGESAVSAMIREAYEEAGLVLTPADLTFVHLCHRAADAGGKERIDVYFSCDGTALDPQNTEPHKCDDMRWFPVTQLPPHAIPYVVEVIEMTAKKEKTYSEFGWPVAGAL